MNPRASAVIIIFLIIGAILYSGSSVLGMHGQNSGFGPNPIMAGARAAKPNNVPTCLTMCRPHLDDQPGHDHDNDTDDQPMAQNTQHARTSAHAAATHARASASAKAVAIANTTTVVQPRTIVRRTTVIQTQPQVADDTTTQPVTIVQSSPMPLQTTTASTLPTTGAAIPTAVGTAAMGFATYIYIRRRIRTPAAHS